MGLPLILAALHLFPSSTSHEQQDPEKAVGVGEAPLEDGPAAVSDDEDDEENEEESMSTRRRPYFRRLGSAYSRTILSRRLPHSLTWDSSAPKPSLTSRIKSILFPSDESDATLDKFVPNYRWTPILAGVIIPFSILLEIPGLTEHWYIRTEANRIVETKSNSVILDVALAFSMACGLGANICLILRFLEKRVKLVTLLTIFFLTVHGT